MLHPRDYEIFSIERVFAHVEADSERLEFMPRNHAMNFDEGEHGRYYTVRREQETRFATPRRYGTRAPHALSEWRIRLVDENGAPHPQRLNYPPRMSGSPTATRRGSSNATASTTSKLSTRCPLPASG